MANDNFKFRVATPEDAPQLQQLVQSSFRAEDSRKNWTADMGLSSRFTIDVEVILAKITTTDSAMLMATDENDVLIACIGAAKSNVGLARLFLLAVDQGRQRGGIGRQVLTYAEDYCQRTWGVKTLGLNALSTRQELILWYQRRGYEKTGELTPFPLKEKDGLVLPDDMCFVELEKYLDAVPVTTEVA